MLDTGSTNSLLNPGNVPTQMEKTHQNPLLVKTGAGFIRINKYLNISKNNINLPVDYDCAFNIFKIHDKFDGIIGNDILEPNNGVIDYKNKILKLNNDIIPIYFDLMSRNIINN